MVIPHAADAGWFDLDFSTAGNGSEVLWAGAFTLVGIIGSVILALMVQRRDFRKRSDEMKAAFEVQQDAEVNAWRRGMAERAMAVITRTVVSSDRAPFGEPYTEIYPAVNEVHTLLHLDPNPGSHVLGAWLIAECHRLSEMQPRGNQERHEALTEAGDKARAVVMTWALFPSSPLDDPEVKRTASMAFGNHDHSTD